MTESLLRIGPNIDVIPSIHGKSVFAQEVRRKFLKEKYDCIAIELPLAIAPYINQGVKRLPYISCFVYQEEGGKNIYVPIDPSDSIMEAIRLSQQENVDLWYIDKDVEDFQEEKIILPDEYPIHQISLEDYYACVKPILEKGKKSTQQQSRETHMGMYLNELSRRYQKVLFVCGMNHVEGIRKVYLENLPFFEEDVNRKEGVLYNVEPSTLYFLQGELPFITYLFEKSRYCIDLKEFDQTDALKELLVTARNDFLKDEDELEGQLISPQKLQIALKFMRNLCLLHQRFTPDLYTIIMSAKATCGSYYAAQVVETAKFYPYIDPISDLPTLKMGIDQLQLPDTDESSQATNRLPGPPIDWKPIDLRKKVKKSKKDQWKYTWNPYNMCSWPPEDEKIEKFNLHVREKAKKLLSDELARTEKFSTSFKDGIDIRETLRNWYNGDLYVKESPPARGKIELVIFIFEDDPSLEKFPHRVTWYAEHANESTLSFYSTDPFANMVGPGVAKAKYGGCALIYPPRSIPDIWKSFQKNKGLTPAEHLCRENIKYSREKHIAYVAAQAPGVKLKSFARKHQKHLIFIPLNSFSAQEINRLRKFHILNGHEIRSFAADFIQDD